MKNQYNMKKLLLAIVLFFTGISLSVGQYTLTSGTGTTVYDTSGDLCLGAYTPGQVYTMTICSDDPLCSHVFLTFDAWTVGSGNFCVYDGNSTSAALIGCNAWGTTQSVMASAANTSGCLTFMFSSPVAGSNICGDLGCNFSCQSVLASIVSTDPPASFSGGVYYIDICQGEEVSIQGAGVYQNTTYPQSDGTSTFAWTFGDGGTATGAAVTHDYTAVEGYDVNLLITDAQGCNSTNDIGYRVRISHTPNFSTGAGTFPNPVVICQGQTVNLTGNVGSEEFVSLVEPVIADTTYLPDGSGVSYESSIVFDYFEPGQILEDIEDMCGICANLEHSFIGDLIITITCPYDTETGGPTTVILEYQHGGGTYLGVPIDDTGGGGPGAGYDYCWTIPADADYLQDMGDYAGSVSTLPAGSYITSDPLDPLVGCELNGEWTLTVTDNWSIDDGYIFGWYMCFDPDIMPDSWTYQNTYPTTMWTPGATGGSMISGTSGTYTGTGASTTTQPFIYTVVDDFGCSYDTTIMVTVLGNGAVECCIDPVVNIITPAQSICGTMLDLDAGEFYTDGNEGTWTAVPTSVTFSDPTQPFTSVTVTTFESYTFTWTEVNNSSTACTSADNVVINFLEQPEAFAGLDTALCGNVIMLDAGTLPGGVTGTWSSVPSLLPSAYANITSPVTSVTIPGFSEVINYEFTWTVDNGICDNDDDVKITFYQNPTPNAGPDESICGSIYDLNAIGVVGEGYWTVTTGAGVPVYDVIFIDPDDPTNPFPEREPDAQANIALITTSSVFNFTWNESNGMCLGQDAVQITFTAGPYAYAGNDNFICGDSLQLNADITGVETLNGYWTSDDGVIFWDHETLSPIDPANDNQAFVTIPPSEDDLYIDGVAVLDLIWNMDNGSCTSSDVVTMTFYQQPDAYAGVDTFVCGQTFTFVAEPSVDTSVGQWLMIDGPVGTTPVYTSTVFPAIPTRDPHATVFVTHYGDYQFQWTESNPSSSLCNTNDVMNITFVQIPLEMDAGNDTMFCQTPTDQYIAQLNATGGFGTGVWHSTTYLTGYSYVNQMSPSTQVTSNHPGTETFCWRETIESGFSQPCIVEKCVDITFEPTPNVALLTGDDWVCGPIYWNTINGSVFDADTAYWFDATHAGTDFLSTDPTNPINVHDTVSVSIYGDHQIYLIAENHVMIGSYDAVCSDTANALNITFYEWPEPFVRPTDTACGNCYTLEGLQSMDTTSVTWSSLSPSGLTFSSTGTIVGTSILDTVCVNIVDTTRIINLTEYYPYGNRCGVSTSIAIRFAGIPYGLFDFDAPECFGGQWAISARADSLPTYQWTFGDAGEFEIDSAIFNTAGGEYMDTVSWVDGDTMHVVDLMVTSSYGCNSSIYRDTLNEPPINYAITTLEDATCGDNNGWVVIQGAGGLAPLTHHDVTWTDTLGDVIPYEDSIRVENLPEGTYWVQIEDIYNCKILDTINILNLGLIDAIIDTTQFTLIDGEHHGIVGDPSVNINLISLTEDARFYRWYIYDENDSLVAGPLTGQITSFEFLADGDYVIRLAVESREGCVDEIDYMYIKILGESVLEVPNVFTPNGDGVNDIFHVHAKALKSFDGLIVNRWGKTLYEWNDWNSPNSGWDGKINGGSQLASPGVYFYVIKAVGIDNNKPYEIKGAFHLIREK
ncbi:MAG: hypothetical protein A2W91_16930 [Bacteroidetes bacterium GWF2_38_335]|nr:MAG: hypothetical protein A2W91_16930 [Bacteroidetes bacterium GWF2_38_335]OFY81369.1 MAG: hypothetical protein A2281_07905 [Bacteroidetes bacterium RIFOXYA12_FULL_38_20]HBS85492.1 hypothetical protein [Bacteroidales bacterium]